IAERGPVWLGKGLPHDGETVGLRQGRERRPADGQRDPRRGERPGEGKTTGWRRTVAHIERGGTAEGQRAAGYRPTRDRAVDADDLVQADGADASELGVNVSVCGIGAASDTDTVDPTGEVDAVEGRRRREDTCRGCGGGLLAEDAGIGSYLDIPGPTGAALRPVAAARSGHPTEPGSRQTRPQRTEEDPEDVVSSSRVGVVLDVDENGHVRGRALGARRGAVAGD